jgi:maltose O-acetyltransferase
VFLNAGCIVTARQQVTIGNDVAVSYDALVTDSDDHGLEGGRPRTAPVTIGDGAWIGARAIILPGVTVGRRAVIGAGSIVTRDIPDDSLAAGQPARVLRRLSYPTGVVRAWSD